jgi:hypothetical protein
VPRFHTVSGQVFVSARVDAALAERFGLLAALHERTFSAELRLAMRDRLAAGGALVHDGAGEDQSPARPYRPN